METININDLSLSDRPREKLLRKGAATLSDCELLAILIGTGTKNTPVMLLCEKVMDCVTNDVKDLALLTIETLRRFDGIGESKAVLLKAVFELARRMNAPENTLNELFSDVIVRHQLNLQPGEYLLYLLDHRKQVLATYNLNFDVHGSCDLGAVAEIISDSGACSIAVSTKHSNDCFLRDEKTLVNEIYAVAKILSVGFDKVVIRL